MTNNTLSTSNPITNNDEHYESLLDQAIATSENGDDVEISYDMAHDLGLDLEDSDIITPDEIDEAQFENADDYEQGDGE